MGGGPDCSIPACPKPELAVPALIVDLLPGGATIGSDLGAVAKVLTIDLSGRFLNKDASPWRTKLDALTP